MRREKFRHSVSELVRGFSKHLLIVTIYFMFIAIIPGRVMVYPPYDNASGLYHYGMGFPFMTAIAVMTHEQRDASVTFRFKIVELWQDWQHSQNESSFARN